MLPHALFSPTFNICVNNTFYKMNRQNRQIEKKTEEIKAETEDIRQSRLIEEDNLRIATIRYHQERQRAL